MLFRGTKGQQGEDGGRALAAGRWVLQMPHPVQQAQDVERDVGCGDVLRDVERLHQPCLLLCTLASRIHYVLA
jgi:hypothetical protein